MQPLRASPAPGARLVRHVGDSLRFSLSAGADREPGGGWQARLRTTLGRGAAARRDIVHARTSRVPAFGASWHDLPLAWDGTGWSRDLVLTEVGFFAAKPYLLDPQGYQHWPDGPDFGVNVQPDWCRSGNILYCAFTRLFGATRQAAQVHPESSEVLRVQLEKTGCAVLPTSGTFRDLQRQLPHIVGRLGCRILHLLPIHPVPTVHARFGRMGSPYAALDLTAVDPALVEFDQRTTGLQQFAELTRAAHDLGARVILDLVINHTGWGSRLFEEHPEYFRREPDGRFACPGAWGVVWEDLVELEQESLGLWSELAQALLTWCRRGVDGFRCDAGYKIPTHVWQYLIARVREEFPDTVFLLEGLGGSWDATESLLTTGGMQWAYSELFQNYSGSEVQRYLDYALEQSARVGTYVHYSETHDNERLAVRGRAWSLLRNQLCALTSVNGGFGYTCGVEWLATEKIRVHERTGLAWDAAENLVPELAALARLLSDHPAFFDGARLQRLSPPDHPVFALVRRDAQGGPPVVVLANLQDSAAAEVVIPAEHLPLGTGSHELLGQSLPAFSKDPQGWRLRLGPLEARCLGAAPLPPEGSGHAYREFRARTAWAMQAAAMLVPPEHLLPAARLDQVDAAVRRAPERWLAGLSAAAEAFRGSSPAPLDLEALAAAVDRADLFPNVLVWRAAQAGRVTPVPPGWWLLIHEPGPFRATLRDTDAGPTVHVTGIAVESGYIAAFPPRPASLAGRAQLILERHQPGVPQTVQATLRRLSDDGGTPAPRLDREGVVLLTNGRGGMARLRLDLGSIRSKYDCALGANLHPEVPVDRHVLVKRVRAWVNADGFISPLDWHNLRAFDGGPPAEWQFQANAGDGRSVSLRLQVAMLPGRNTVVFRFARGAGDLPLAASLTLRVDLEDRSFHAETRRNPGAEDHFKRHCRALPGAGFEFTPAADRRLTVRANRGKYHPEPEWCEHIGHPFEASRGQVAEGDAYSPGWFEIPIWPGEEVVLDLDAEAVVPLPGAIEAALRPSESPLSAGEGTWLETSLRAACTAFLARRGAGRTVIAGYPWFLDWGRDTLIAARGLIAGGWLEDVAHLLDVFGGFADRGTLPNSIHGTNASNRDTSDAPLWFAVAVEEFAAAAGTERLRAPGAGGKPPLLDVVRQLIEGYLAGTPNGIRVDAASGLVWSPSHFTWMDTNHPAGTPREGYPIDLQALWVRALEFLAREDAAGSARWSALATRARASVEALFWRESDGWYSDVLVAGGGTPAAQAVADSALRSNALLWVAFGLAAPARGRRCVAAALEHLIVPGAVRSLAPLPVHPPLPIRGPDGRLLNDPERPYWGRYEGDEDTRRKPAYHNGTAWVWPLGMCCEALYRAWEGSPEARRAARALLSSATDLLQDGCVGHLPEIIDGDAPHTQRGCDAQAWSATEVLRVWQLLRDTPVSGG